MQNTEADVALVEVGASPLEPYNGETAIKAIQKQIQCTVLCASDPYAVLGVMQGFGFKPSVVTGPAANTHGGVALIRKLCQVEAINFIDPLNYDRVKNLLLNKLGKVAKGSQP